MRRAFVALTIIVSSFGFISAALPAVASAANCTGISSGGSINSAGQIHYTANVSGCTDVSQITFLKSAPGTPDTGWADNTQGMWWTGNLNGCPTCNSVVINISNGGGGQVAVSRTCWYTGAGHNLINYFLYKIKGRASGQYGPVHAYVGTIPSFPDC